MFHFFTFCLDFSFRFIETHSFLTTVRITLWLRNRGRWNGSGDVLERFFRNGGISESGLHLWKFVWKCVWCISSILNLIPFFKFFIDMYCSLNNDWKKSKQLLIIYNNFWTTIWHKYITFMVYCTSYKKYIATIKML